MPAAKPPEFRRRALDLVAGGEPVTTAEKRELVELRRKNRVLETEVDILKRASAYFARENVLPK